MPAADIRFNVVVADVLEKFCMTCPLAMYVCYLHSFEVANSVHPVIAVTTRKSNYICNCICCHVTHISLLTNDNKGVIAVEENIYICFYTFDFFLFVSLLCVNL